MKLKNWAVENIIYIHTHKFEEKDEHGGELQFGVRKDYVSYFFPFNEGFVSLVKVIYEQFFSREIINVLNSLLFFLIILVESALVAENWM